jgi:hypothetical protein
VLIEDPVLATAILDRLLHHATTLNIKGESYRLKEKRRAGLLGTGRPSGEGLPAAGAAVEGARNGAAEAAVVPHSPKEEA